MCSKPALKTGPEFVPFSAPFLIQNGASGAPLGALGGALGGPGASLGGRGLSCRPHAPHKGAPGTPRVFILMPFWYIVAPPGLYFGMFWVCVGFIFGKKLPSKGLANA